MVRELDVRIEEAKKQVQESRDKYSDGFKKRIDSLFRLYAENNESRRRIE